MYFFLLVRYTKYLLFSDVGLDHLPAFLPVWKGITPDMKYSVCHFNVFNPPSHLSSFIINNHSASLRYLITTDQKTNEKQVCLTSVLAGRRVVTSP